MNCWKTKFPGKERHLLRCQIARISHACSLAPKSYFKTVEDNENEIELDEEFAYPEDWSSLESWVHIHANILKCGRATHVDEEDEEKMNEK